LRLEFCTLAIERLVEIDHHLSDRLSALATGQVRTIVSIIAHTGDAWPWIIVGAFAALTAHEPLRHIALRALITFIVSGAIAGGLKLFFRRKRPAGPRGQLYFPFDHNSFPSGHATRVAALAIVLGSEYTHIALPLAVWALAVALSRVMLRIHYLFDIIVGVMVGITIGDFLRWLA